MNFNPKAPQVYKPTSQKAAGPPVYRPQQIAGVPSVHRPQHNTAAQLKPANNFRLETRPAPPVYRPQQAQSRVQPKSANNFRVEKRPPPKVPMPTSAGPVERLGIQARLRVPAVTPRTGVAGYQRADVLQRSCWPWCCPWGSRSAQTREEQEELVPKAQPLEDDKPILLGEGQSRMVKPGDKVLNHGVTSCGLVLAFGSDGILAYHWPFMSLDYLDRFKSLVVEVGTLKKIEIYTNPFPSQESRSKYQLTLRNICYNHTRKTRHYIYGTQLKGDVTVTLKADGVEHCEPAVTDELFPD